MQSITNAGHNSGEVLGPKSRAEFERSGRITPGGSMRAAPFFPPHPPYAASGSGCWITDVDGRRIFDCANNFFSLVHGHAFPPVIEALHRTLDAGTAFSLPTPSETALAQAISRRSPRLEQVRFANSGTEAVMFAVKAARAITGRPMIAKFEGAYHGAYDYVEVSLDSSAQNWGDTVPNSVLYAKGTPTSVAAEVLVLPFDDPQTCVELIGRHRDRLAAVLVDPLSSRVAMVPMRKDVRDAVQDACREYGILLVLDEVVSYRLGYHGAHELYGFEPDLVALGKIIGGGLPVGAIAGPAKHMAVFDHTKSKPAVSHGGTFTANPLTMAAGLAALDHYDEAAVARLNRLGERLRGLLADGLAAKGLRAQVSGTGSFFRFHLKTDPISNFRTALATSSQKVALAKIHLALLKQGFLVVPNCSGALSTPMSDTDIEVLAHAFVDAVQHVWENSPWE
ncbi:aspartate aminotransferase family protein [Mesorhizobium sp. B4-1-4]|uniref:aspartate aminotransferase family protein n=1 Tax=Mesorhizobium sp. B4-1-4 TaxID=2589888 RepID=UPI00112DF8EE|nr:aminotransferase class III-fold pyridoxal phosphate-dependent enzyme [Mesorhizobium sp. B4-1-4]UCI31906.1 aminotransferase class III-fold pyridoxal phosphate-dependent enzyme [Mesorhizobium sp. B4-1-4]